MAGREEKPERARRGECASSGARDESLAGFESWSCRLWSCHSATSWERSRRIDSREEGMKRDHSKNSKNKVELKRVQCQGLEGVNMSVGTYLTASIPSCSPKSGWDCGGLDPQHVPRHPRGAEMDPDTMLGSMGLMASPDGIGRTASVALRQGPQSRLSFEERRSASRGSPRRAVAN